MLVNMALGLAPMRHFAERLYFHTRNDAGIDREAYVRWLDQQVSAPAAGRTGFHTQTPQLR